MKKSPIVGIAVGAVALSGIAWAAAPVLAAQALIRAAKAGMRRRSRSWSTFRRCAKA